VITARAIGILEEIAMRPSHGGAAGLSRVVGEGREAIQNAITLLRKEGLLETITNRMSNGKTVSTLRVTSAGYQLLETRIHILQTQLNSYKSFNAYSINSKPNSETSSREAHVEYYETEEERLEAQRKHYARKQAEKTEANQKRVSENMVRRSELNAANWSVTDSTFEFANQMHGIFHIAPWQVTRSRFRYALANKRAEFGTTGDVEIVMMRLYFDSIRHDTQLSDPEMVWKRFITQFALLLEKAKQSMVTEEQVEEIKQEVDKSRDWLRNV